MAKKRPPPTDKVIFLFCDVARQEQGGKITLIGYLGGSTVRIASGTKFPVMFPLGLVVVLEEGEGLFNTKIEIIDPKGNIVLSESLPDTDKQKDRNHTITINVMNFVVSDIGGYNFVLSLDGTRYFQSFNIETAP